MTRKKNCHCVPDQYTCVACEAELHRRIDRQLTPEERAYDRRQLLRQDPNWIVFQGGSEDEACDD